MKKLENFWYKEEEYPLRLFYVHSVMMVVIPEASFSFLFTFILYLLTSLMSTLFLEKNTKTSLILAPGRGASPLTPIYHIARNKLLQA